MKDKGVHAFLKSISPKVNVIERLEFELAYSNVTVLYVTVLSVSHHATGTPLPYTQNS